MNAARTRAAGRVATFAHGTRRRHRRRRWRACRASSGRLGQGVRAGVAPMRDAQQALDGAPEAVGLPTGSRASAAVPAHRRVARRSMATRMVCAGRASRGQQQRRLHDELDLDLAARRSFTSHGPCGGRSRSMRARMAAASARIAAGSAAAIASAIAGSDRGAQGGRAGDHPGAGQRHALPGPGVVGVVAAERGEADGDRALVAGRAQPHVHGIQRPVDAGRRQRGDQAWAARMNYWLAGSRRGAVALRGVGRVVVDQHQVEVGAGHHLPPAGLAQQHHGHAAAGDAAVALGVAGQHAGQQHGQRRVGQGGAGSPAASASSRPSICATARRNSSAAHGAADDGDGVVQRRARRPAARSSAAGSGSAPSGDSRPSSAAGTCGQVVGQRRGGAQHGGDAAPAARAALQQREQLHPGGQAAEQRVGAANAASGSRCAARARSRPGSTASSSARARSERNARGTPARQDRTAAMTPVRFGEAQRRAAPSRVQRPAVRGRRQCRTGGVVLAHPVQVAEQRRRERRAGREAHEAGEPLDPGRVGGQGVGLPVRHHLQPVLDAAQERGRRRAARRAARAAGARPRPAPPARQRGRARAAPGRGRPRPAAWSARELHAADAALAELHVVPGDPQTGSAPSASAVS